jgi:hypothetical protein
MAGRLFCQVTTMNVPNVSSGGVDRRTERTVELVRPDARQDVRLDAVQPRDQRSDSATISDESRVRLDAVRDYTDRLRQPDPDRRQLLDEVRARLDAGDLDHPDVFRAAADAMLRGEA